MRLKQKKISLLPSMLTVGFWTLASRIFGFVRDIMMASFLGSTAVAEAFIIAFALPNMFRRFFAEGALNTALIPMLSDRLKNIHEFKKFSGNIISWLIILLLTLVLTAEIFMPQLVTIIASGFKNSEKFKLCIDYGRIMFPYIFLISLGSAYAAILNSLGYFKMTAAAPILLNITLICALFFSKYLNLDIGLSITYSIPFAGLLQMLSIILTCYINGMMPRLYLPKLNSETKKLLILAGPAILAGGVVQVNLLVGRQIASFFDGAIAWLNYADRVFQLPLGVIGIALGIVLLPDLSRKFKSKDFIGVKQTTHQAIVTSLYLVLPSTIALMVIPHSIIRILFERGEFNFMDTHFTAQALFIFAIGLPSFVLQKIFSPVFFANNNTKTPFRIALVSMLANIFIAIALIQVCGFLATAVGTTISSWLMVCLLIYRSSQYELKLEMYHNLFHIILKISACSLLMGLYLYQIDPLIAENFSEGLIKYLAFIFMISTALLIYLFLTYLFGLNKFLRFGFTK